MSEQTTNGLLDDLTGGNVQTDHGGLTFADLVVLLLDLVLLLYTGWRSFDFLSTTVPDGWQVLALVGLWGLDIGAIAWSLVWIFGSTGKFQNWVSMAFFIIDLVGVALTSLTDSLMYSRGEGAMSQALGGVTAVAVPLVLFGNVVAGFVYHMTSPETKRRRKQRAMQAEHNSRMDEVADMEKRLTYTEAFLLARQDALDKAVILADLKVQQDAVERQTQMALRDKMKVHGMASNISQAGTQDAPLEALKKRLSSFKLPGRDGIVDPEILNQTVTGTCPNCHQPNKTLIPIGIDGETRLVCLPCKAEIMRLDDLPKGEHIPVPILTDRPDLGENHTLVPLNGGHLANP